MTTTDPIPEAAADAEIARRAADLILTRGWAQWAVMTPDGRLCQHGAVQAAARELGTGKQPWVPVRRRYAHWLRTTGRSSTPCTNTVIACVARHNDYTLTTAGEAVETLLAYAKHCEETQEVTA